MTFISDQGSVPLRGGPLIRYIILFIFSSTWLKAATHSIPLNMPEALGRPASDLISRRGSNIDSVQAFALAQNGTALEGLNPIESALWQNTSHSLQPTFDEPHEKTFIFNRYKLASLENFRAYVTDKNNPRKHYLIIASIHNHFHILRAALLRLIGYDIELPIYMRRSKIRFNSADQAQEFIDRVGEKTLTARDKWIVHRSGREVTFKGFILVPSELTNVPLYFPVMARGRQRERRVFRSLLDIYALTDFRQNLNAVNNQVARVFDNNLIINHPFADQFADLSLPDLKWIQGRLISLAPRQIRQAIRQMDLPEDISALIYQKLIGRMNQMTSLLWEEGEARIYPENPYLTYGRIQGGRLTREVDPSNYVVEFFQEDPDSPYQLRQMTRMFATQIFYAGLSSGLDFLMDNYLPGFDQQDAAQQIASQIQAERNNPDSNGIIPLKLWSRPIMNGRVFVRRNIVFGQFLNTDAPIQLVDTFGGELNLGVFNLLTGVASNNITPAISAGVTLSRSFTHIRAMPDLRAATRSNPTRLLIPHLMQRLGRVIKDDLNCSYPEGAWVEEAELNGITVWYINYDQSLSDGRQLAIAEKEILVSGGAMADRIFLRPVNRDESCADDLAQKQRENVEAFVQQFALNETFIITDSARLNQANNISIPLPIASGVSGTASLGNETAYTVLRNIYIKRTEDGMEVTFQNQRNRDLSLTSGLSFYLELFRHRNSWMGGSANTKTYRIPIDNASVEEQKLALKTIREVLRGVDYSSLEQNYRPHELQHEVNMRLWIFKLLFFKIERLQMNQDIQVIAPMNDENPLPQRERTRTFYVTIDATRRGNDYYNFIDRTISSLTGFISLGSSDTDPGLSPFGHSRRESFFTELETTPGAQGKMMSRVEFARTGWKIRRRSFFSMLESIEAPFAGLRSHQLIDRSHFQSAIELRSYNVKTTILIYPRAIRKMIFALRRGNTRQVLNHLKPLYGVEEWDSFCQNARYNWDRYDRINNPDPRRARALQDDLFERGICAPLPIVELLALRQLTWSDKRSMARGVNKIIKAYFTHIDHNKILRWLGEENFFGSIRVRGYRENHAIGQLEYIGHTVGTYSNRYKTGPIDEVNGWLHLNNYQFRGLFYTPGF